MERKAGWRLTDRTGPGSFSQLRSPAKGQAAAGVAVGRGEEKVVAGMREEQ